MPDQPDPASPPQPGQSGGVNASLSGGSQMNIDGDVVGHDKTVNYNYYYGPDGKPIRYATRADYLAQIIDRHQDLEFVGIPELKDRQALRIEDVFIHLRVDSSSHRAEVSELLIEHLMRLPPREVRTLQLRYGLLDGVSYSVEDIAGKLGLSPEETSQIERKSLEKIGPQAEQLLASTRISAREALKANQFLVILGDPGTGKTTLLKYITVAFAQKQSDKLGLNEDRLPIFIRLYDYMAKKAERREDYPFVRYLYTHAEESLALKLPPNFFEDALQNGNCSVCLDGLDELARAGLRREVTHAVASFANRYRRNRFIITSRIVGYDEAPLDRREFVHVTVLPLADDDIREFVQKWYRARAKDPLAQRERAEHLTKTIMAEPRIKALAANPLMLTIIALVHRIEAELPNERVKLYEKCITALLETREKTKGLKIDERMKPLLERLAYWMHTNPDITSQTREVLEGELKAQLSAWLAEEDLRLSRRAAWKLAKDFLTVTKARTGVLVERGEGVYAFAHPTFQEYLAAIYIKHEHAHSIDEIWEVIRSRLHDSHWREVILLLLGSLNEFRRHPTELVRRIFDSTDDYEDALHRHKFLAATTLADRVRVSIELHDQIVDSLLQIANSDKLSRWDALEMLGSLQGDNRAAEGLLALARDQNVSPEVRSVAAQALGQIGRTDEATELLLTILRDKQAYFDVRIAAAQALGQFGRANEAASILLDIAHDNDAGDVVRNLAAQALGQLGRTNEAATLLLMLAREGRDVQVQIIATEALGQLCRAEEAAQLLLALACDKDVITEVRGAAAQALGQLGHADQAVLVSLYTLARDGDTDVWIRTNAALALGQLDRTDDAAEILVPIAHNEQVHVRMRAIAAQALGQLGHDDEAAQVLFALARDKDVDVWFRNMAAQALGQISHTDEVALLLLELACDKNVGEFVRVNTVQALGRFDHANEAVLSGLLTLAHDKDVSAETRCVAAQALDKLGHIDDATAILLTLAPNKAVSAGTRLAAAQTLGDLGRPDAAPILLALARDEDVDGEVRRDAYDSLKALVGEGEV